MLLLGRDRGRRQEIRKSFASYDNTAMIASEWQCNFVHALYYATFLGFVGFWGFGGWGNKLEGAAELVWGRGECLPSSQTMLK